MKVQSVLSERIPEARSLSYFVREPKALWLDLGCGTVKQANFIGLDRYPLPGVDVIADLDQPLPFRDNSVDLVYASHSLEHVADLVFVMKEIYRVCCHGAQVCIVAPYYQQSLNLANPYHKQVFNEHTPRFWTQATTTPLAAEEFAHPHAAGWGLRESDWRISDLDLRCLKMEFFYFPAYRDVSPEEQRAARQKYLDVCDQIMFHLLVVKAPIAEAELQRFAKQMSYYDPPFTQIRRLREALERHERGTQVLQETVARRDAELADLRMALDASRKELQAVRIETAELADLRTVLDITQQELQHVRTEKAEQEETQRATQSELQAQLVSYQHTSQELQHAHTQLATLRHHLERFERHKQRILPELLASRRPRATQWFTRFRPETDLRTDIDPAFQQLKDDSLLFARSLKGFRLQPSRDLRSVPFLSYPLDLDRPGLSGVLLAPILDFPGWQGQFGIEIVSPANTIVLQTVVPLADIDVHVPTCFRFAPIADSHQGRFWLRVFARDVVEPVRIFEWRKYRFGGFGPLQSRAFCGFLFA